MLFLGHLAGSGIKYVTPDLRVLSSSPTLGVEPTQKLSYFKNNLKMKKIDKKKILLPHGVLGWLSQYRACNS